MKYVKNFKMDNQQKVTKQKRFSQRVPRTTTTTTRKTRTTRTTYKLLDCEARSKKTDKLFERISNILFLKHPEMSCQLTKSVFYCTNMISWSVGFFLLLCNGSTVQQFVRSNYGVRAKSNHSFHDCSLPFTIPRKKEFFLGSNNTHRIRFAHRTIVVLYRITKHKIQKGKKCACSQ